MAGSYRGGRGKRASARPEEGPRASARPLARPGVEARPSAESRAGRALGPDEVQVNGYSEGWLRRGFPWVYRDELIAGHDRPRAPGAALGLRGPGGERLGVGIWAPEGKVALRVWRFDEGPIDAALVAERLRKARARRALPPETSAWRWLHGENDDAPGFRVDVWGEHLAVALDDPSLEPWLPAVVEALREQAAPRAIWRSARPGGGRETGALLWGDGGDGEVVVLERGLRFLVHPGAGHDVGLFCDMRDMRQFLAPHCEGRRVLNLFAHTGAFSVLAAANGAASVHTVDLSANWLRRARQNLELNGLSADAHVFQAEDSLAALDQLRRKGARFDLIIADPPSFSHGPRGEWSIRQDLGRLVAACCRVLSPEGWLLVASNHGGLSPKDFGAMVQAGALKAETPLRLLHEGAPPLDFPAALSFPESRYLKCWLLGR